MGDVVKFRSRQRDTSQAEVKQQEKEQRGSVAWERLCSKRQPKLSLSDRVTIAENLYEAIIKAELKPADLAKAIWPRDPAERRRVTYRCLLPKTDSDAQRLARIKELKPTKYHYRRFIEEYLKRTKKDRNIVADDLLFGTTLHPSKATDLSDVERLHSLLQKWVGELENAQNLLERYRRLCDVRTELEEDYRESQKPACIPRLTCPGGELDADNWRELIPFLPHVCLGIADQFNWICAYEDARFWPLPRDIEHGAGSLRHVAARRGLNATSSEISRLELEIADAGSDTGALSTRLEELKAEAASWAQKWTWFDRRYLSPHTSAEPTEPDPNWVYWHEVFLKTLRDSLPEELAITWQETARGLEPMLAGGSPLSSLTTTLREARHDYFRQLAAAVEKRGVVIPDEVFVGGLWVADNQRPMMEILRINSELRSEPLPTAARSLCELDEETKSIFDEYRDASASIVWLTICLSHDGSTLVPTLVYRHTESTDSDEFLGALALDSPRALLEVEGEVEFGIAWPSVARCVDRIRQLAAGCVIRDEWKRTAEFLKHHPFDRPYQENRKIQRLLMEPAEAKSQETPHAD
jgi:hypothetical protein